MVYRGSDRGGAGRGGVGRGRQGRDGRASHKGKAEHRVLENFYYVFFFYVFFFNIVLTWKFVGASKVSVLYVYIDNKIINGIFVNEANILNN